MPLTKDALTRFLAIDKCLQRGSKGYRYTAQSFLEAVNKVLEQKDLQVGRSQLYKDLQEMERQGAPIFKNERNRYEYYYADPDYNFGKHPISEEEKQYLLELLAMMKRWGDLPGYEVMEQTILKLQTFLGVKFAGDAQQVVLFDTNVHLRGLEHLLALMNHINRKECLEVAYKPFDKELQRFDFHPYVLKEYQQRWYCIGLNEQENNFWTLALDRLLSFHAGSKAYIAPRQDMREYFEDFIGVSLAWEPERRRLEKVILRFTPERWKYIETKPLHPSQKKPKHTDKGVEVVYTLIPNRELKYEIMRLGPDVEVLEPEALRKEVAESLQKAASLYL